MQPLVIEHATLTTALGAGLDAQWRALTSERGGLRRCDFEDVNLNTWIGRVDGLEDIQLPRALRAYDCRNNRLADLGLAQDGFENVVSHLRARLGRQRIGVYLGTSTGGIGATEHAYRRRDAATGELPPDFNYRTTHNIYSVGSYVRERLGLGGPGAVISTACSSSAKVFASAYRALRAGLCDAAVVGGVDSLCQTTLHGFNALQLLADEPCRPADARRRGISIGEAAGFAIVRLARPGDAGTAVLGYGESSDAHHMSSPDPSGAHAAAAMTAALARAGIAAERVDFVNLHGTGTLANDASEDKALTRVFGPGQAAASTKGWTGHALGAAGIVEAIFCVLCLERGFVPGSLNTRQVDPALSSRILLASRHQNVDYVVSNAFGFGGSNCSLVIGSPG